MNVFCVPNEVTENAALHFAQELRNARSKALADAEDWQELVFVFERLAKFMTSCQKTDLGSDEAKEVFLIIARSRQEETPEAIINFKLLLQQVVCGRNSEFHGGAAARRFARHCVEFSFLLEDGLKTFMNKNLGSVMSSPVMHIETWRMLADVRRLMLENSFTWVPVKADRTWLVISDHALVKFLESDRKSLLTKTVADALLLPGGLAQTLEIFNQNSETRHERLLTALARGPVLVSDENASPDRIVGIVTAFDLL